VPDAATATAILDASCTTATGHARGRELPLREARKLVTPHEKDENSHPITSATAAQGRRSPENGPILLVAW